jgi:two-component system CheB/CheR fusion protein
MNLSINNLDTIITNVVNTLESEEIDVQINNNLWYKMKVRPYKTIENRIDGVILAFIDMNDVNFSARLIEEEKDLAQTIIETVHHPVLLLDSNFIIKKANKVFYTTFILSKEDVEGKNIFQIENGSWDIPEFRKLLQGILVNEDYVEYFELESHFGKSGRIKLQMSMRKLKINSVDTGLMLISMERII